MDNSDLKPLLIVLTEIWISESEIKLYQIDGYSVHGNYNNKYRAGGTLIYVNDKANFHAKDIDFISADCVAISCSYNDFKFQLLAVYRLQSLSPMIFMNELDLYLTYLANDRQTNGLPLFYVGDINIDSLSNGKIVDEYKYLMSSHGFESLINEPTRITFTTKTCIDHLYIKYNNKKAVLDEVRLYPSVLHLDISDHSMVLLQIEYGSKYSHHGAAKGCFTKLNYAKLNNILKKVEWRKEIDTNNFTASKSWEKFVGLYKNSIKEATDKIIIKNKPAENYRPRSPWITTHLIKQINTKNFLYKAYTKQPTNEQLRALYTRFRNSLRDEIRTTKNNYYINLFEDCKGNMRKQWKVIDSLIGLKNKKCNIKEIVQKDGSVIKGSSEIANLFNDHFLNVVGDSNKQIEKCSFQSDIRSKNKFPFISPCNSIFLKPTNPQEIYTIIKNLKNKSSPGFDGLTSDIVKKTSNHIIDILVELCNLSLRTGEFPDILKESIVVPIQKKGNNQCIDNFRPITLLPVFSKILEKIVKTRLLTFYNKINFFSVNQYGFREGIGTETAIKSLTTKINEGLNEKKKCAALFLDIQKAFDSLDKIVLLKKLEISGIRGVAGALLESYLSGRSQRTRIDETLSQLGRITTGIPQGSVLSPILFLVFINDLCNATFEGEVLSFADDTAIFYKADNEAELQLKIQKDLLHLRWWFCKNKLIVNANKSNFIKFNLYNIKSNNYKIVYHKLECKLNTSGGCNCDVVKQANSVKYLGITIDSRLAWSDHIGKIKNELFIYIRKFYYLKEMCPKNILIQLYHTLVESRINYGLLCYGSAYQTHIHPLMVGQNHIIRLICNKPKLYSALPLFRELSILPVRHAFLFKSIIDYFKNGLLDSAQPTKPIALRNAQNANLPKPTLEHCRRHFSYIAIKLHNILPLELRTCVPFHTCKKNIKKFILQLDDANQFFDKLT